jgi:hypothetical protein
VLRGTGLWAEMVMSDLADISRRLPRGWRPSDSWPVEIRSLQVYAGARPT